MNITKKLLLTAITLFLFLSSHSEEFFEKLLNEKEYYRAVGEYKRYSFRKGIEDSGKYYLDVACIYALSGYTDIAEQLLDKNSGATDTEDGIKYEALLRSYIAFKNAEFSESVFEYEDFADSSDSLLQCIAIMTNLIAGDSVNIAEFIDDSIKTDIKKFSRRKLKDPYYAFILSSFSGAGEYYSEDYLSATRDFAITSVVTLLTVYAFMKNPDNFSIDKPEWSFDYFKTRDYLLTYFVYSTFMTRFQNGSRMNAEKSANIYNDKLYKKYLLDFHGYIEDIYEKKMFKELKITDMNNIADE